MPMCIKHREQRGSGLLQAGHEVIRCFPLSPAAATRGNKEGKRIRNKTLSKWRSNEERERVRRKKGDEKNMTKTGCYLLRLATFEKKIFIKRARTNIHEELKYDGTFEEMTEKKEKRGMATVSVRVARSEYSYAVIYIYIYIRPTCE